MNKKLEEKINNKLADSLIPLLDILRNNKESNTICKSFVVDTDDEIRGINLAVDKICSSNPDIKGRVDVFDHLNLDKETIIIGHPPVKGPVNGTTITLFLDKDKDRFDHPDINRFYAHYPEFYTGLFNQNSRNDNALNWFIKRLFVTIITMEERSAHFGYIKLEESTVNYYGRSFVLDKLVDKIEWGRFKYRVMSLTMRKTEYLHFLIYDHEPEDKEIEKQKEYLLGCSSRLERW